jgi:hypothetical protein
MKTTGLALVCLACLPIGLAAGPVDSCPASTTPLSACVMTNEDFASVGGGLQRAFGKGLWYVDYTAEFGEGNLFRQRLNGGVGFTF